jgi:hypothetical protein
MASEEVKEFEASKVRVGKFDVVAKYQSEVHYRSGVGVVKDHAQVVACYREAAE